MSKCVLATLPDLYSSLSSVPTNQQSQMISRPSFNSSILARQRLDLQIVLSLSIFFRHKCGFICHFFSD